MRRLLAITTSLVALLAPAAGAAAPKVSFNDLEQQVMCVSCNVPLNIAESPQAAQERQELRNLVASGLTRKQILDRLVHDYGPNVLAQPKGKGFDLFAWAVPIGAAVALIALGLVLLPRWRRARRTAGDGPADDDDGPALSSSDRRRLDEDMARLGV